MKNLLLQLILFTTLLTTSYAGAGQKTPLRAMQQPFYTTVNKLLDDFEFDLKRGDVHGLSNIAIRHVTTEKQTPTGFSHYLQVQITDKILKFTRGNVRECAACQPNADYNRVAQMSGIEHFMDITQTFQPTGMALLLVISEPASGSIIWSRSYNSELPKKPENNIDPAFAEEVEISANYKSDFQYRLLMNYEFLKDMEGQTKAMGIGFRVTERYDELSKEIGAEAMYFKDPGTFLSTGTATSIWGSFNATLLFVHTWNRFRGEDDFNAGRGSITLGVGGTYSSGFLGGLIRASYEWRMAQYWGLSALIGFRPPATVYSNGRPIKEGLTGIDAGLGVQFAF